MATRQYVIQQGGADLNDALGFMAQSVVVDNMTNQFCVIGGAQRSVPPYTFGAMLPFPSGTQAAQASLRTPAGVSSTPPPLLSASCTVTFGDYPVTYNPGSTLQNSSIVAGSVAISAGSVSINGNVPVLNAAGTQLAVFNNQIPCAGMNPWTFSINTGPSATKAFTLPNAGAGVGVGIHALGIILGQNASQYANANLFGITSGTNVTNAFGLSDSQQIIVPLFSSVDTSFSLTIGFTALAGQNMSVYVVAILDTMAVQVQTAEPLNMVPFDQLAGSEIFWDRVGPSGPSSIGVSQQQAKPAPWQAPTVQLFDITGAYAANSNTQIVAGVAGQSVFLHAVGFTIDTPTAVGNDLSFCDGSLGAGGTRRGRIGTQAQPPMLLFEGARVTSSGNGLWITPSAAVTLRGYVAAGQG